MSNLESNEKRGKSHPVSLSLSVIILDFYLLQYYLTQDIQQIKWFKKVQEKFQEKQKKRD